MLFSDATAYIFAFAALTLALGSLLLLIAICALGNGTHGAVGVSLGVAFGDIVGVVAVCLGLGVWLHASPKLQEIGQIALLLYLGWLASETRNDKFSVISSAPSSKKSLFASVIALAAPLRHLVRNRQNTPLIDRMLSISLMLTGMWIVLG
ncbi:MAG: LysE family transporter [Aliishimia sp.]